MSHNLGENGRFLDLPACQPKDWRVPSPNKLSSRLSKVDTKLNLWHLMIMKEKSLLSQIGNMPITAKKLARLGISRNELNRLLASNKLLRLGRGVYQPISSDLGDENLFRAATMRIQGPSAVCLISALAFYHLTDEIPKKTWLLVDVNRKSYLKDIRLFRSHNPHWKVGIEVAEGYRITNLERTIVDCLTYQARLGTIGIEGLKNALKAKQTTLAKIADMAKQLGVFDRIVPYIQVLA